MEGEPNSAPDPVEEILRNQIEEEKKNYKSCFGRLKAMKTEIEHLQHQLQRSKIKLQKDFESWWMQEASKLQQDRCSERTETRPIQDGPCSLITTRNARSHDVPDPQGRLGNQTSPPTRDLRALTSTSFSSTSIPLTGDQQTDADILAFVRARQNLLSRTGAAPR